jgi:hypothetical protein
MASTFEYMQFALGVYATESEENKIGNRLGSGLVICLPATTS